MRAGAPGRHRATRAAVPPGGGGGFPRVTYWCGFSGKTYRKGVCSEEEEKDEGATWPLFTTGGLGFGLGTAAKSEELPGEHRGRPKSLGAAYTADPPPPTHTHTHTCLV